MKKIVIGLINTPGLAEDMIEDISRELSGFLHDAVEEETAWHFEYKTDPLTSSAEYIREIFDKAESIKNNNNTVTGIGSALKILTKINSAT
ncbi:hypothetical protein [Salinicoccus halodurans]|nr:hypothetical protein [Salinicoccus halodurans]